MSTFMKVDPSTLGWVKNEIDETLKQARVALEEFVEHPSERAKLRFCITHLHQVVGTLLMVELDGAATLAREIEALAEAVFEEQAEPSHDVLEALTRGILVLPDYLARLQYGYADVPIKHLPLLNELRTARKAAPLSELEFFSPDLSVRPPAPLAPRERLADAEYAALARQVRPSFQGALLNWLRDANDRDALTSIASALEELQLRASMGALEQLFWIAGGLLEGLIQGDIEPTPERKKHLARLDQQVKKIVDGTEKSLLRSSSETLTRAILYEIAQVSSSNPKIRQLKQVFNLDALLGRDAAHDGDDQTSPEVLQSVARVLAKEIEQAQDLLAAAFESHRTDSATLAPLRELLHKMSSTVEMLGLPILKRLFEELTTACDALADGRIANPEAASMPMAQALVLVESSARGMPVSVAEWRHQIEQSVQTLHALYADGGVPAGGIEVTDTELTETEYKQLVGVIATEVGVNLAKIEEALEGFAGHTAQLDRLDDIPKQLGQIQGALQVLGVEHAVELTSVTRQYIENIRAGALAADAGVLDGLAVCIGTIGAYVDGLRAGRRNLEPLIESALVELRSAVEGKARTGAVPAGDPLAGLRARLDAWFSKPGSAEARTAVQEALAAVANLTTREPEKARRIVAEIDGLVELVGEDPAALSPEVQATLRASCEALAAQCASAPAVAPAVPKAPSTPASKPTTTAPADDFDAEILQIFIEDARDVLGNVQREYVNWRADTDNHGALTELRRGYHTLKGSGRMVGAGEIAEFAWAVESMLNSIRDGKMPVSPAVFEILEQSQSVLPVMVSQLEGGPAPDVDVDALRRRTHELIERRGAPAAPAAAAPPAATVSRPLPKLDGVLLDIFTNEARGHVTSIQSEVAAARLGGDTCLATPSLTRSIHTLQGNARSLGIPMMAEACAELEKLVHALRAEQLPLVDVHLKLFERFTATVGSLVEAVARGEASADELMSSFDQVMRGALAEHEKIDVPGARASHRVEIDVGAPEAEIELIAPPDDVPAPAAERTPARIEPPPAAAPEPVVDAELLEIFREEAVDILNSMEHTLSAWRADPDQQRSMLPEIKRALHTLKGGARMAGVMSMGNVSHNTESLLMQIENRTVSMSPAMFDLLEESHDLLVSMLHQIGSGQALPEAERLMARLAAASSGAPIPPANTAATAPSATPSAPAWNAPLETTPESEVPQETEVPSNGVAEMPAAAPPGESADAGARAPAESEFAAERRGADRQAQGQIRVKTDLLNSLVNYAGEVSISRARMEQQIYGFRDNLGELRRNVTRFREQLRELEIQSESQIVYRLENQDPTAADFDPLEFDRFSKLQHLTRSLTESLHDLTTIQLNMGSFVGEAETVLQQQARINTELQEGLMRTRMVEFSTQAARLRHIVRQTARELGKRADIEFVGADVQIDRTVLERMIGPFEHMIRNSLDHGLESEAERTRQGKPPAGRITITNAQEGSEIVIRFADDGAGMNLEKIRAKAIERGLVSAEANLTEDDIVQFVLLSGFSTASTVTHLSGRGVGMDVVHSEVKQLGGSMVVNTEPGKGTSFVIRLPLTLSIAQALIVYVGEHEYAVPIATVTNIIECPVEQLSKISVGKNPLLNFNDQLYSFMNLGARLDIPSSGKSARKVPVLLARAGTRDVAMQVDGLGGTREIVIKSLGAQLAELKGVSGATIMGDGRVVLILDLPGLWHAEDMLLRVEHHRPETPAIQVRERPIIMVVDDSLTVRKVTGKHLQKRGFDVMVAKDGVDAVEQLRGQVPDLMLVDIEMPRMDGYELTGRVRSESRLKHIPIIMITSRAGAKHRQRAFELGVDMYMSKPYQEDELFKNIDQLLERGRPAP